MDAAPFKKTAFAFAVEFAAFVAVFALTIIAARAPIAASPSPADVGSGVGYFLAAFIGATSLLLLLLRTVKGRHIFSALFALAILSGATMLGYRLFGPDAAVLAFAVATLVYYKFRRVLPFDLILLAGIAGIAAHVGAGTSPIVVVILLAILAVYDIIAVYLTRHMVAIAETLLRSHVFFAMILPVRPKAFLTPLDRVSPDAGFLFLGTGDLVLPSLLVASAASRAPLAGVMVGVGALFGLAALHAMFVTQRRRKPMPALPPLALGAIIGFLASLLSF